jgi:hypothetical protein
VQAHVQAGCRVGLRPPAGHRRNPVPAGTRLGNPKPGVAALIVELTALGTYRCQPPDSGCGCPADRGKNHDPGTAGSTGPIEACGALAAVKTAAPAMAVACGRS